MAVGVNVPAGVTDWVSYLTSTWTSAYAYRGHGAFSSSGAENYTYGQWVAGNAGNTSESGVLLSGDFSYGQGGAFTGDIDSLEFGTNLAGSASAGYDLDTVLTLDLSNATATTAFTYAIYYLSNQANLSYLWTYLSEQGTVQEGNDGAADTLYSFSGNDTLTGGTGADTFVFDADYVGVTGDWGTDTITDFTDGVDKIKFVDLWLDYSDFTSDTSVTVSGNVITYVDSSTSTTNTITLTGFTGTLDSSDFTFA